MVSMCNMVRQPDKDNPTSEEQALEFDGTNTDQLDDTYRFRVVTASEGGNGAIGFDDRGSAQWKWNTELGLTSNDASGTFNELKALDNPALTLEGEAAPEPEPGPSSKTGYDPYATGVFVKPKSGR